MKMVMAIFSECLDEEYKCAKGNCIPKAWLCDLIADCDDAEDENQEHCGQYGSILGGYDMHEFNIRISIAS